MGSSTMTYKLESSAKSLLEELTNVFDNFVNI